MEMPQMISIAGLKARGWTQALITLLGEPDVVRRNSHYAKLAPMRLRRLKRIANGTGMETERRKDAPAEFLERITVNFIRHNLTAYDRALEEVAGRVGIASAVQAIRARIYSAIGESCPALADECSRQLMRRGL